MSLQTTLSSLRTRRMLTWFVPVVGLALYLILVPPVPDFAAQATRAAVFRQLGSATWWPGWYGGLELPTYSVIAPGLMATIGVARTGVIAAGISIWAAHQMLRDSARPRAASVVFAATVLLNLFGGRITFLIGLAAATLAVLALVRRHPWLAAVATVVSVLGSPLAGLFTGIVAAAVLISDRSRRREALFVGAATGLSLGTLAVLFHNPGVMASPPVQILLALIGIILVAVACRERTIRVGALIVAIGLVMCLVVPNSVGLNLTRMVWLLAAPLIVGYGHRPDRHVVALTGLALVFPMVDVTWQLAEADSPSAQEAYYQPLLAQLHERLSGSDVGQRVEVVEPQTKGAARYVGESMPVARGWERQADIVDNPIFYDDGALTPASYRKWLGELAVSYVAVPATKLDFASVDEAKLIAHRPPLPAPGVEQRRLEALPGQRPPAARPQRPGHLGVGQPGAAAGPAGRAGAAPDPLVGPPGGARRHPAGVAGRAGPRVPVAERLVDPPARAAPGHLRADLRLRRPPEPDAARRHLPRSRLLTLGRRLALSRPGRPYAVRRPPTAAGRPARPARGRPRRGPARGSPSPRRSPGRRTTPPARCRC